MAETFSSRFGQYLYTVEVDVTYDNGHKEKEVYRIIGPHKHFARAWIAAHAGTNEYGRKEVTIGEITQQTIDGFIELR